LTAGEALGVDILTTTLDLADQAGLGSKIYANVNQNYQQNVVAQPSVGVSIGSTYSLQQQINQILLQIQQIQYQINYLQYLQSNNSQ